MDLLTPIVPPDLLLLAEVLHTNHSEFAAEQSNPPPEIIANLNRHGRDCWAKLRDVWGPTHVENGWRCPGLNKKVGGQATSLHLAGLATDNVPLKMTLCRAMSLGMGGARPFDEMIFECTPDAKGKPHAWIHLQSPRTVGHERRLVLMTFDAVNYEPYNPSDPRIPVEMR